MECVLSFAADGLPGRRRQDVELKFDMVVVGMRLGLAFRYRAVAVIGIVVCVFGFGIGFVCAGFGPFPPDDYLGGRAFSRHMKFFRMCWFRIWGGLWSRWAPNLLFVIFIVL